MKREAETQPGPSRPGMGGAGEQFAELDEVLPTLVRSSEEEQE